MDRLFQGCVLQVIIWFFLIIGILVTIGNSFIENPAMIVALVLSIIVFLWVASRGR